jgi:hypothetical protein
VDNLAEFLSKHSTSIFLGKQFEREKIRSSITLPVASMDGTQVPSRLPSNMEHRLTLNVTGSTILCDRWDNEIEIVEAGDAISIIVHLEKVLFAKRSIHPQFVAAGVKVLNSVQYPISKVPRPDPVSVPLPEPTDSEEDFFKED